MHELNIIFFRKLFSGQRNDRYYCCVSGKSNVFYLLYRCELESVIQERQDEVNKQTTQGFDKAV